MSTFEASGCQLHYDVRGHGPALLFNHGGFGGLGTGPRPSDPPWIESLAATNTVITYDRRSSGRSGTSSGLHTLELFSADALALLHHLDIDRAVIWGESAGVPIASTFALMYPDQTQALILTDGAPWFSRDGEMLQRLKARIQILERDGPDAGLRSPSKGWHGGTGDLLAPASTHERGGRRSKRIPPADTAAATGHPEVRAGRQVRR